MRTHVLLRGRIRYLGAFGAREIGDKGGKYFETKFYSKGFGGPRRGNRGSGGSIGWRSKQEVQATW